MPQPPSVASAMNATRTTETGEIYGVTSEAQQPSYPSQGENPRFNESLLGANEKEREQTRQDEEQLMEVHGKNE